MCVIIMEGLDSVYNHREIYLFSLLILFACRIIPQFYYTHCKRSESLRSPSSRCTCWRSHWCKFFKKNSAILLAFLSRIFLISLCCFGTWFIGYTFYFLIAHFCGLLFCFLCFFLFCRVLFFFSHFSFSFSLSLGWLKLNWRHDQWNAFYGSVRCGNERRTRSHLRSGHCPSCTSWRVL